MSALAAVLLFAATPAAVPPEQSEIVVIGEKLNDWRGSWGAKKGVVSCRTTRSTGDKDIDAVGCEALVSCASPLVPQFKAIAESKLPKAERQRRMDIAVQPMVGCLTHAREAGIAALADRRAGA